MGSNGKQYYLMEVIALVLKKVKERVRDKLFTRFGLDIDSFSWVLTVPALWGESARRMMKEAAYLVRKYSSNSNYSSLHHLLQNYMYIYILQSCVTTEKVIYM